MRIAAKKPVRDTAGNRIKLIDVQATQTATSNRAILFPRTGRLRPTPIPADTGARFPGCRGDRHYFWSRPLLLEPITPVLSPVEFANLPANSGTPCGVS